MLHSQAVRQVLHSTIRSAAPTAACQISSRSGNPPTNYISTPHNPPKARIQHKSTLTLRHSAAMPSPQTKVVEDFHLPHTPHKKQFEIEENSFSDAIPNLEPIKTAPKPLYSAEKIDRNRAGLPKIVRKIPTPFSNVASDPYSNEHLPRLPVDKYMDIASSPLATYKYDRKVKKTKLSYYMDLLNPVREDGSNNEERPLALVYPWLMAKEKHVKKYTKLYTDLGIDVLQINISPHDLLRPVPRAHVAAIEVLEYLLNNPQWNKLILHGMSIGAYGFMEVMTKMEENEDRYLCIRPRFVGQVWDSPCDLPGLKEGVSRSVTDSRPMQENIMNFLDWFLKVRYQAATRHYVKTQDMYHKNYCNSACLFLYSRADPVASPAITTDQVNSYYQFGFETYSHVFNESGHVGHLAKYGNVYRANVMAFLQQTGFLEAAGIQT